MALYAHPCELPYVTVTSDRSNQIPGGTHSCVTSIETGWFAHPAWGNPDGTRPPLSLHPARARSARRCPAIYVLRSRPSSGPPRPRGHGFPIRLEFGRAADPTRYPPESGREVSTKAMG